MRYELPVTFVVGGAILGLILDANDAYEKIWKKFFPPPVILAEAYPFLDVLDLSEGNPEELAGDYFKELTKQIPTQKVAATEHAIIAFDMSVQTQARGYFCDIFDSYQYTADGFGDQCKDGASVYQQIANYSLTNTNEFAISKITVTFQRYSVENFGVETLDVFVDQPEHLGGCLKAFPSLYEEGERPCFANIDGNPFEKTFSQPLLPGETLIIPIYVAYIAQFQSEEYGNEYTGIIKSGFWLPQSVSVDGRVSIERSRPMSPSPVFSLGEFEIRG